MGLSFERSGLKGMGQQVIALLVIKHKGLRGPWKRTGSSAELTPPCERGLLTEIIRGKKPSKETPCKTGTNPTRG